jgi:glycosyltransferase involved in cell wall biosynthesis
VEATRDADVIVLGTTFCAPLVPHSLLPRCILDAHNLEWRVVAQLARRGPRRRRWAYRATQGWTRAYERRLARTVAGVWAVSQEEAEWFEAAGARRVWVIPNGVDLPSRPPPLPAAPALIFVGSLQGLFNRDGVKWFLETCWPAVRRAVPGVTLILAGRGGEDLRAEGVESLGFVDDLGGLYGRSSAAIVPLRLGAGTRLKVPEAMAYGRPVVSTPVGVEGHGLGDEDGVLIAASSEDFAAACIGLLRDAERAAMIGAAGRRTAETRFEWSAVGRAAAATVGALS